MKVQKMRKMAREITEVGQRTQKTSQIIERPKTNIKLRVRFKRQSLELLNLVLRRL